MCYIFERDNLSKNSDISCWLNPYGILAYVDCSRRDLKDCLCCTSPYNEIEWGLRLSSSKSHKDRIYCLPKTYGLDFNVLFCSFWSLLECAAWTLYITYLFEFHVRKKLFLYKKDHSNTMSTEMHENSWMKWHLFFINFRIILVYSVQVYLRGKFLQLVRLTSCFISSVYKKQIILWISVL